MGEFAIVVFACGPAERSMSHSPRISVLFLLLLAPLSATSQESIPIKVAGGAILVAVRVKDRTLNFMLDTGSQSSSIDPSVATELDLVPRGKKRIQKNFRDLVVAITRVGPITVLGTEFPRVELAEVTLAPLSKALGTSVEGVLGLEVLQNISFKLNYSQQTHVTGPLMRLGNLGAPVTLRRSHGQFLH
jgi:hypothetical protein